MAEFQYHASDDLQDAAFSWLKKRCYGKASESFQKLISQTKLKLNHVQGVQFNETLCILGKLRRGQAEALWHMGRFDHALKEMQLCKTENCHEFSEENMSHWTMLADQRDRFTGDKQTAMIGYEIACHFIPPHDVLKRSHLLSKMLAMCIDAGNVQSFQKKAAELFTIACQMKVCESQEIVKIWMGCGKKLLSSSALKNMSIECFTLAETFLPSNDSSKLRAKISYSRAKAILTVNESTQLAQAIKDANAYVEQRPTSVRGYRLLWKCCLPAHNYDDALAAFRNTQEILTDKQEDQYKEFFEFFTTAISQEAFEIFKAGCPVPKCFVQKLIIDSVVKPDVRNLSVLFCEGWAAECDASCVPLDLVLASEVINHEELVPILLQQNAHAKGLPKSSKSPLSVCLEMNKLDLAVLLLHHGADERDLVERDGETPFHASLRIGLKKENLAIFQFVLDSKRYPIDLQDKDGNTLLHFLCRGKIDSKKNEAMIILLKAGANPLITNNEMKTSIDIACNLR